MARKYIMIFHLRTHVSNLQDQILRLIPSNEPEMIQKYLQDYVSLLQNKIDQYQNELNSQLSSHPTTLPSPQFIDIQLKEFVRLHHCDLLRAVKYQIAELNTTVSLSHLSKYLGTFELTSKQVVLCTLNLLPQTHTFGCI